MPAKILVADDSATIQAGYPRSGGGPLGPRLHPPSVGPRLVPRPSTLLANSMCDR